MKRRAIRQPGKEVEEKAGRERDCHLPLKYLEYFRLSLDLDLLECFDLLAGDFDLER